MKTLMHQGAIARAVSPSGSQGVVRKSRRRGAIALSLGWTLGLGSAGLAAEIPLRSANPQTYTIQVNSSQDGAIAPDAALTLREAIALTNGDLSLGDLSTAEQAQIQPLSPGSPSQITFALSTDAPQILELHSPLPPLRQSGLILDGLGEKSPANSPRLILRPAQINTIPWGLLVLANDITIRGLGFQGFHSADPNLYPFVGNVVVTTGQMLYDLGHLADVVQLDPPRNLLLEDNQFGTVPQGDRPRPASAFGVVIFDGMGTTLRHNQFLYHSGSALLTGKVARSTTVLDNLFVGNGGAELADALRLEGSIGDSTMVGNTFCHNRGQGIYLFKPEGAIAVENNLFYGNGSASGTGNGTPAQDAAVYLMGSGHRVLDNRIVNQGGPGIAIAGYPRSVGNRLQGNTFAQVQGLSIDLVTRRDTGFHSLRGGDGPNPPRNSHNRRLDTGNGAVLAPQFVGLEFFPLGDRVRVSGTADPGATVDLYRVLEPGQAFGPLNELWVSTTADGEGRFTVDLVTWELGDRLSAIATDPVYGTSEPAENAVIRDFSPLDAAAIPLSLPLPELPALCQGGSP